MPDEKRESFLRETGRENLFRLQVLAVLVTFFASGSLLINQPAFSALFTVCFLFISLLIFLSAIFFRRREPASLFIFRLPVILYCLMLVWWCVVIGRLDPLSIGKSGYFVLGLIVVYSLFVNSAYETAVILVNGIVGFFFFRDVNSGSLLPSFPQSVGHLFFITVAVVLSGIMYHTRLVSFLNWENISAINNSLKREVTLHNTTMLELEASRSDLDRQVIEKTRHLRETNQKLQEEIAEKNYSDKVKSILYRISGFVNRNNDLKEVFHYIHEQLGLIMDASNLMIGIYDVERQEIIPMFRSNPKENLDTYRLGRSLSSFIIRNRRSLLVDRKGIHDLVTRGEVEAVGVPVDSWLGVPLMVETKVVGILMVQSYDQNTLYDKADLQLLEYIGEHLALAVDRHETHQSLVHAKEQAEESDRLKSSFLANLSHEVRTPMNAIVGFSELLGESGLEASERKFYSNQVLENGHKLLSTLTNIVELAKIQARQMQFDIQGLRVIDTLGKQVEEFRKFQALYSKQSLEIKASIDDDASDMTFSADPVRFHQLFACLAENAVKFTHEGSIEMGCQKFDQKTLLFWIKDTGIGMTDDEIQQIFSWFIKGQKSDQKLYRGTGLGLTIAKLLIENMKGRIWVESEPGSGSCFYFTLPVAPSHPIRLIPNISEKANPSALKSAIGAG